MNSIKPYFKLKMLAILFWSFACGLPLILTTSTLAAKLSQEHISLLTISIFGIATIAYPLKYLLTPLVELYSPPVLTRLFGPARAWMILMMTGVMSGLIWIGYIQPSSATLWILFIAVFFTVLCSSITDIAEAEYRIELLEKDEFSHGIACYNIGYRCGMITGGGAALLMTQYVNWQNCYYIMSACMLSGIISVILQPHTKSAPDRNKKSLKNIYLYPVKNILARPEWLSLIALIALYNYSENLLILLLNPFLLHTGFNLTEIGFWQGSVGGLFAIIGSFSAGIILTRLSLTQTLSLCAILFATTHLLLVALALFGSSLPWLQQIFHLQSVLSYLILGASTTAYSTLVASQCQHPYTASQNAFFTSIMAASKLVFMSLSGVLVTYLNWQGFLILLLVLLPFLLWLIHGYQRQSYSIALNPA